uniref:Mab-21 domain-containing protein n=1 Tax=Strongyloides papillosus TaxID=174720 RepID=A0A0N5CBK6_STREA
MDPRSLSKWRQERLLRKSKMYGANYLRQALATEGEVNENDNNVWTSENDNLLDHLPKSDTFLKSNSTNLTDHTTEDDKLTYFLADFLRIKDEGGVSDQTASKQLFLFASFLPKDMKCPITIDGCRSYLRKRVPEITLIYSHVEEHEYDGGRLLLMPFDKIVKKVVKRNIDILLPQTNEEGVIDIKLQLHTDGVEVAKSSRPKMWPLNAVIENLPGKVRVNKNNVILIAIHLSKGMPDFKIFCQRFVRDFNSGLQVVFYNNDGDISNMKTAKFRLNYNLLTGDIPVIRSILNFQCHACHFDCLHCYCKASTEKSVLSKGNKRTYASSNVYALRTNDSYLQDIRDMTDAGVLFYFGVKGLSHLGDLIKVPEDVAIDYFHSVLLGPLREDIFRIMYGYNCLTEGNVTVKIRGFVDLQIRHFSEAIELSLFPSEFKRKIKPLTEIDSYKGIEWKNMLLYAISTILSDICNGHSKPLYMVNLLLANSLIVLMKDNINAIKIKKCQDQLYQWYNYRTVLLSNEAITLKAHQVTHLSEIVEQHGSLCSFSCFFGEGLAYNLTRMISLKTVNKSLNQLKTRLTDYSVINAIAYQKDMKKQQAKKFSETRMSVRNFC